MLREIACAGTPGRLLLEPRPVVQALLDLCPDAAPESAVVQEARETLSRWHAVDVPVCRTPATAALAEIALRLSEREREVLELVAQGLPNKLLARRLSLSPHTVKRHLANILYKLDCDTRGQAADLWRRGSA